MATVSLSVNGKAVSAEANADTLLVDFIRENLGMTGTQVGCDSSQCGELELVAKFPEKGRVTIIGFENL